MIETLNAPGRPPLDRATLDDKRAAWDAAAAEIRDAVRGHLRPRFPSDDLTQDAAALAWVYYARGATLWQAIKLGSLDAKRGRTVHREPRHVRGDWRADSTTLRLGDAAADVSVSREPSADAVAMVREESANRPAMTAADLLTVGGAA